MTWFSSSIAQAAVDHLQDSHKCRKCCWKAISKAPSFPIPDPKPLLETALSIFIVHGPFELDFEKRPGGRTLTFEKFWSESSSAAHLANERGCYVFAIRNKGLTPIYVGKATKTFKQETFNQTNKHKYHNGFSEYAKGTPLMFFVVHPTQKGKTNSKQIGQIEDFLIQAGVAKNPDIQNIKGTGQPNWGIKGVVRGSASRPNAAETSFARLFDIHRK